MVKCNVIVDTSRCKLCNLCVSLCPTNVFKIVDRVMIVNSSLCIACYGCVRLCPENAISIESCSYTIIKFERYRDE